MLLPAPPFRDAIVMMFMRDLPITRRFGNAALRMVNERLQQHFRRVYAHPAVRSWASQRSRRITRSDRINHSDCARALPNSRGFGDPPGTRQPSPELSRDFGVFRKIFDALGDDLRQLHHRLAQRRVFDDVALNAVAVGLQLLTQTSAIRRSDCRSGGVELPETRRSRCRDYSPSFHCHRCRPGEARRCPGSAREYFLRLPPPVDFSISTDPNGLAKFLVHPCSLVRPLRAAPPRAMAA